MKKENRCIKNTKTEAARPYNVTTVCILKMLAQLHTEKILHKTK